MGKLYVPSKARTAVDRVRQALDQAERLIGELRDAGPEALELLFLFDHIEEGLHELEQQGVDVRVERARFDTIQRQLDRHKRRFLNQASAAMREERARLDPASARWWWYLDKAAARQRRRRWRRIAAGAAAVIILLTGAWLAYQRFLAPPPEVGQAYRRMEAGKSQLQEGNQQQALEAFDAATKLTPDDPEPWLWKGVVHDKLGESAAAADAFATAEHLYETTFDFVLNRGGVYLQAGQLGEARADVKAAIKLDPASGWGYYLRAGIAVAGGDYEAGLADLERAAELAGESGDVRLQTMAARQQAQLMQMQPPPTPR